MDLFDDNIFCKEANVTSIMLINNGPFPYLPSIKNGLVLELLQFRKSNGLSWPAYRDWVQKLLNNSNLISINALRKSVLILDSKKMKLEKNLHRDGGRIKLKEFFDEQYYIPCTKSALQTDTITQTKVTALAPINSEKDYINTKVNRSLAVEIVELQEKVYESQLSASVGKKKMEKIRTTNHNLNKKMKRKEQKISELLSTIISLKHEIPKVPNRSKNTKSLSNLIRYYKAKCKRLNSQLQMFECKECDELDMIISKLKEESKELREENARLIDKINDEDSRKVNFYSEGKYSDDLRICIMELLTYNIGILKIEPVLQSVFKLLNVECDKLPKRTTINEILIESRSLAHTQIADVLTASTNNTLHSDGTTKYGHKYQSYQVSTENGSLTLGLQVLNNLN